jgi:hypothetical protein
VSQVLSFFRKYLETHEHEYHKVTDRELRKSIKSDFHLSPADDASSIPGSLYAYIRELKEALIGIQETTEPPCLEIVSDEQPIERTSKSERTTSENESVVSNAVGTVYPLSPGLVKDTDIDFKFNDRMFNWLGKRREKRRAKSNLACVGFFEPMFDDASTKFSQMQKEAADDVWTKRNEHVDEWSKSLNIRNSTS